MSGHRPMDAQAWALLAALSILWGGSFFFTGIAVREAAPLTIVALRVSIAAVALLALVRVLGQAMPRHDAFWAACFGMGILNNVIPFSLIAWAQSQIPSGLASILNATTPLFAVIVTHVLTTDEKATTGKIVGVLIGFGGVAAMVGPDALRGLGEATLAQLAILGATLSYAFSGVFGRRFAKLGATPIQTAAGQLTASAAMLLPVFLLVERPWTLPLPSAPTMGAILALALLSTALAYILFFRILARAGATNLMLVTFLIPVSAILLGSLVLGERLEPRHAIGMALIAAGLVAIDGRMMRWRDGA